MPTYRRSTLAALALSAALLAGVPVQAQTPAAPGELPGKQPMSTTATNISPQDTHTLWSPSLPAPPVSDNAPPMAFLQAAQRAIAANRTGEAQEALERAESRALDRSVRPSMANDPSKQPLVAQIARARQALGAGDKMGALKLIEAAQHNPDSASAD